MDTESGYDSHLTGGEVRKSHFLQFSIRQSLVLLAVSSVLLALMAPAIQRRFREWRLDEGFRKTAIADVELAAAVRANDVSAARHALEAGAKPDRDYSSRPTGLLSTCIHQGQLEMMKLLIDYGADVERTAQVMGGARYGPALFVAVRCDQPADIRCQMIRLLVDHGADIRSQDGNDNLMDVAYHLSDGQTGDLLRGYGLPYGPREMAAFNRLDELKHAVREDPELITQRFQTTWATAGPHDRPTLLAIALYRGYREMSQFLIDAGAPLGTRQNLGRTLLHEAALGGDPELIRLLIARGLDVNAIDEHFKDTPLEYATSHAKPLAVAALLEAGANVNHQDGSGRTHLHAAVWGNRIEVVKMLLTAGADPTIADVKGQTPLDVARAQNPEIAKLLEQAAKISAKSQ